MSVYLLTGAPKSGKTTVLLKVVETLKKNKIKVGGFLSPERTEHGTRTAFYVKDVESGKKALLASVEGNGPRVGKYAVDVQSFEDLVLPLLKKCDRYEVFVIDEIGAMELKSKKFANEIEKVLGSGCIVIATVGRRYIEKFKTFGEVIRVDKNNRHVVEKELIERVKEGRKMARKKKVSKKKVRKSTKKTKKTSAKKKKETKMKKKEEMEKKKVEEKEVKEEKKEKKKSIIDRLKDFLGL